MYWAVLSCHMVLVSDTLKASFYLYKLHKILIHSMIKLEMVEKQLSGMHSAE